jgi:hypothetical protein
MGFVKQYKPKEENVKKLKLYLKKIENGGQKDKSINSERK